jgi:hypothetical protein
VQNGSVELANFKSARAHSLSGKVVQFIISIWHLSSRKMVILLTWSTLENHCNCWKLISGTIPIVEGYPDFLLLAVLASAYVFISNVICTYKTRAKYVARYWWQQGWIR